ncbi:MAG: MBL fold metallo-hydrolase [Nocardioides sp.]|nr:MBL fold metallo-hydrolase [Nocardioides sp.]
MQITKLNNAAVVIASATTSIAVDIGKDVAAVDVASLAVDAAFVSHIHPDHFDRGHLERLARPVYGPVEVVQALQDSALVVTELGAGDRVVVGDLEVVAEIVDHGPISFPIVNLGFEVTSPDVRAWFAGDIARDTEPRPSSAIDVVLVPVGGGKVFEPDAAVAYCSAFPGALVVPIHFDHSMSALSAFCEQARAAGLKLLPLGVREQASVSAGTEVAQ